MSYTDNETKVMQWVLDLSQVQGMYGRLYNKLKIDDVYRKQFCDQYAKCNDMREFVMEYEGI